MKRRILALLTAATALLLVASLLAAESNRVYLPLLAAPRPTPLGTSTTATSTTATSTATGTVTSTVTATSTATGTATSTATPTSTATNVPPAACAGIYPIGISAQILDGERFRDPGDNRPGANWRVVSSGPYAGKTARRLFVGGAPDELSFLRWKDRTGAGGASADSARELALSLTFPGNIAAGFEEAPWPTDSPPADYPKNPGSLNVGDWIYGISGFSFSNDVDTQLDDLIRRGALMALPIYSQVIGNGGNAQFLVGDIGRFVLLSRGTEMSQRYIDLVFLGREIPATPCPTSPATPSPTVTSTPTPTATILASLVGDVAFRPEYAVTVNGRCQARSGLLDGQPEFRDTIQPSNFRSVDDLIYPNVGRVRIQQVGSATTLVVPIVADEVTGRLTYRAEQLPPEIYTLRAELFYKHPLDRATEPRRYSLIIIGSMLVSDITVLLAPGVEARQNLHLAIAEDPCAAP